MQEVEQGTAQEQCFGGTHQEEVPAPFNDSGFPVPNEKLMGSFLLLPKS